MLPTAVGKPTASVTIEPQGPRSAEVREHAIKVTVRLGSPTAKNAEAEFARRVARASLARFSIPPGGIDRLSLADISTRRPGKNGPSIVVVGAEGTAICAGRPDDDSVAELCATLSGEGCRVAVREKRECAEPGCNVSAMVDWNRPAHIPSAWHDSRVCGQHNYRSCAKCKSVYVLTSTSFVGQAPSVHCQVCGLVLVSWGTSKLWIAELVTRASGDAGGDVH